MRRLREADPPVIARIQRDVLLLDPRTLDADDADAVVAALLAAFDGNRGPS
jgi:seryl-tRNA(Sec) selenium transferase